jgi:hypothetical protein
MAEYEGSRPAQSTVGDASYRKKLVVGFSLFAVFFAFYMGTAILQTPAFKSAATIPCLGMPLGLLLSLAIFPVSWLLIIFFFVKSR